MKKTNFKYDTFLQDIMNDTIKKDILAILTQLQSFFAEKEDTDIAEIKNLSDHTIHNSSIFQDEDSISMAILVYSLSKLLEKKHAQVNHSLLLSLCSQAHEYLEANNVEQYRQQVKALFDFIRNIDSKLKLYIEEVVTKGQINKAGKIYAHGISIGRASEILGISQWELLSYVGKTTIPETPSDIINVRDRLKFTRGLFS